MAHVLLIDDDDALLDALALAFEDAGHEVSTAPHGMAGLTAIRSNPPDVVVSDVNMPGLDGFTLCRRLREAGETVPVLLLTSRDNEVDEALGLELGADDYVAKPFSTRVLLARVSALIRRDQRRAESPRPETADLELGQLAIFPERLEVKYDGHMVTVTVTEFHLIETLSRRPGVVFSRDRLLDLIRGDDSVVAQRIIDTYVRRLRRKFESVSPDFDCIETVIGAGYRWKSKS
ncbi:MAG: response regulator transcription factor [Myxococcales bacterium]|nr:response regulator transcription factor [Myxococcales bacterium]